MAETKKSSLNEWLVVLVACAGVAGVFYKFRASRPEPSVPQSQSVAAEQAPPASALEASTSETSAPTVVRTNPVAALPAEQPVTQASALPVPTQVAKSGEGLLQQYEEYKGGPHELEFVAKAVEEVKKNPALRGAAQKAIDDKFAAGTVHNRVATAHLNAITGDAGKAKELFDQVRADPGAKNVPWGMLRNFYESQNDVNSAVDCLSREKQTVLASPELSEDQKKTAAQQFDKRVADLKQRMK